VIIHEKFFANAFVLPAFFAAAILGAAVPARAGQLFAFDYSLPGTGATPMSVSASGFFTTTDLSGSSYTITGVFGTWNGSAITGILSPGSTGGSNANDNLLFSSGPLFDFGGLGFTVNGSGDNGAGSVNLYYDASQGGYNEANPNVGSSTSFSVSPATPNTVHFAFSYSMDGQGSTPMAVSAQGNLTTLQLDPNSYLVTGISGSWNGGAISSLLAPGAFAGNDNLVFGADPHVTSNGLSFAVSGVGDDGSGNVNVFDVGSYTEFSDNVGFSPDFNLTELPEPASFTLLCIGVPFGLALARRRSRAK
jgi:hypothetical protein